jgi:hypothetical protein
VKSTIYSGLLLAALFAAFPAAAQETNAQSNSASTANSQSGSLSAAQSNQRQNQGQAQGQDQGQSQSASSRQGQAQQQGNSNLVGNANQITFDNDTPSEQKLKYAPAMSLGVMNPTTPCFATYQGGVSGMGFGVALGGGVIDPECTRRENARMLSALNENASAVSLLCGNAEVAARAPALCKKAEAIAMNVAQAERDLAAGDTMKGQKEAPKQSKPAANAPAADKGEKDAPKDSKEAPKSSKDEPTSPPPGPNYRWQNGAWQQVSNTAAPVDQTGYEGRDIIVQNFASPRGR